MRWLLVSRQHSPAHGGIGTYVQRFCSAAQDAGWHVEVVTQPGEDWPACARVHEVRTADMDEGFAARLPELRRRHVVRPYCYALWSLAAAQRLTRIDGSFDAIEFVDCQAEGFASLGSRAVLARHEHAAFLVHAHTPMWIEERMNGADALLFGRAIYHDWERRAVEMADGVITTSNVLADTIECAGRAAMIVPYPIKEDAAAYQGDREQRIVLVGSVQPRKGVDLWARSLNSVLRSHPRATALLIGPDTSTAPDGLSMAAHVQRLLDPRIIDRFRWLGALANEEVREIVARSALLVVPSRLESFSFAAAEALLAGTPVILSDRTGIAEHVPSLLQIKAENAEAWASAQIETLADPAGARETAARARCELLDACSPSQVLAARATMIEGLRRRLADQRATKSVEGFAEMASFVAGVDARDASIVSAA